MASPAVSKVSVHAECGLAPLGGAREGNRVGGQEQECAPGVRGMVAGASPVLASSGRSVAAMGRQADCPALHEEGSEEPPNKRLKLTRLAAAPGWLQEWQDGGTAACARWRGTGRTASQLKRGVRQALRCRVLDGGFASGS